MTKVTFYNYHNPDWKYDEETVKSNIGKTLPLTNMANGDVGAATITDVQLDDVGIEVTYETEMNFSMRIDNFQVEAPE